MHTRSSLLLAVGLLGGCHTQECCDLVGPASYTWRGQVVDSATGTPVTNIQLSVRERPQHDSAGWMPAGTPEFGPNGHFAFTYELVNFQWCNGARPDTTLILHLDFADPLGNHSPSTHVSRYTTNCSHASVAPAEDTALVIRMNP